MDRLSAQDFEQCPHATADALASYVIGALSEAAAEKLEAHVYACDACSEALAREARLERAFELLAEDMPALVLPVPVPVPVPVFLSRLPRSSRFGAIAGAVAIAASALLLLGPSRAPLAHGHGSASIDLDAPDAHVTESSSPEAADAQAQILFARDLDGG